MKMVQPLAGVAKNTSGGSTETKGQHEPSVDRRRDLMQSWGWQPHLNRILTIASAYVTNGPVSGLLRVS